MPGPPELSNVNHTRARDLLMRLGWNAISYQILNPGFTLWFSTSCEAVAGYVRAGKYWVIAGAPICHRSDLPRAVEELENAAREEGCRVCYFGASSRLYEGRHNPPQHSVAYLGAQPVWNPARWADMVARRPSVRAQFNRAINKGVTIREWSGVDAASVNILRAVLNAWLKARPMPPMHFLVEPDTLTFIGDRRLFVAHHADGVCGFLVASPVPARRGWLIEQIIRHPDAPNGTNELLLNEAMAAFTREGSEYMTLGLVPLSSHRPPDGGRNPLWLDGLFRWGRAHGRRFYNFAGLEAFKSKFCPEEWEPIFAISTEKRFSLPTLWAIVAVFSEKKSPVLHGVKSLGRAVRQEAHNACQWIAGGGRDKV